jgi:hypothetical protein
MVRLIRRQDSCTRVSVMAWIPCCTGPNPRPNVYRNRDIRRELKAGKSAETLAAQHGLTVAQIRRIARQGKA